MMAVLIGADRVQLISPLGQGGAATVYAHPLRRDQCVKIYTKPDEVEPERIRFLAANPPPQLMAGGIPQFAWPLEPAYDEQTGLMVGFSMPRLQRVLPLSAVVDPGSCGAAITRVFRWKAAIGITRLVHTLHLMHPPHIVADGNLENFLVHRSARVTAIDLDSTHFCVPGSPPFLCHRHRPEMQPPELVSATAPIVDRGQDQDAFSVFILVHRLIREGIHPFDARYAGPGTPLRLHERIEQGIWADSLRHADYRPKAGPVPFTSLPTPLQDLFRRMFDDGIRDRSNRPDVTELLAALELHRSFGVATAAIGRRAWRRELNPTPTAHTKLRSLAEACHRHRHKAVVAFALTASIASRVYFSGHSSTRPAPEPNVPPERATTAPAIVPPQLPTPHRGHNLTIPQHELQHEQPRTKQRGLPTPRLWKQAEDAAG